MGTTVRLASYITAIGRANLFRCMHIVERHMGVAAVVYTDTDSLYIDVPITNPLHVHLDEAVDELHILDAYNGVYELGDREYVAALRAAITSEPAFKRVM